MKQNYKTGYIVCISLILAGAIGNIIDSVFYGVVFNESTHSTIASFVPVGEGYSEWLHGKVVDMFYFPIIETNWPEWIPGIGGEHFIFSVRYLILPMLPSVAVLWRCCYFTVSI